MPHFENDSFRNFIRAIINLAAIKAGGNNKLANVLDVDISSLNRYWNGIVFPNPIVFLKMLNYIEICNLENDNYREIILNFVNNSFNNHKNNVSETSAYIGVDESNFRRWLSNKSIPNSLNLGNILLDINILKNNNINNLNTFKMFQSEYNSPFLQNKNTKSNVFYVKSFSNNYCSASI